MRWLSLRLVRLVLLGSAASLLGHVNPACAQVLAFRVAAEPAPAVLPVTTPAALPPASAAPPPAALPPAAPPLPAAPNAVAPAKAVRIKTPDAHEAVEGKSEDDEAYDEGDDAKGPQWYGWQTLIADAPSVTAFMAGVSMVGDGNSGGSTLAWAGFLGYELVPSIIHFSHGNPGRGFASLGMRFGMPLAGAIIGATVTSNCNSSLCEAGGAGVGIILGMGGAIAIDAAVLAYDDGKPAQTRHRLFVPLASLTRDHAWLGVGGEL